MSTGEWILDGLIVLSLLILGARSLYARDLFKSVFIFIVFGLIMSLAWVRLKAPDIALAEAAIGAGLVGVLLLDAARHFSRQQSPKTPPETES
jgi:energy-converting hydrogenase B subunit D